MPLTKLADSAGNFIRATAVGAPPPGSTHYTRVFSTQLLDETAEWRIQGSVGDIAISGTLSAESQTVHRILDNVTFDGGVARGVAVNARWNSNQSATSPITARRTDDLVRHDYITLVLKPPEQARTVPLLLLEFSGDWATPVRLVEWHDEVPRQSENAQIMCKFSVGRCNVGIEVILDAKTLAVCAADFVVWVPISDIPPDVTTENAAWRAIQRNGLITPMQGGPAPTPSPAHSSSSSWFGSGLMSAVRDTFNSAGVPGTARAKTEQERV